MLARLQRRDRQLGVRVVRGGDGDQIDLRGGEHPLRIRRVPGAVVFAGHGRHGRRLDVAEAAHGDVRIGRRATRVRPASGAAADQRPAQRPRIVSHVTPLYENWKANSLAARIAIFNRTGRPARP